MREGGAATGSHGGSSLIQSIGVARPGRNPARDYSAGCIVHHMLTIATRLDVMNRLGRAMADPTRSRILMTLLEGPSYPAVLARDLGRV